MVITPTPLAGAYLIDSEAIEDERGVFYRSFCREEFEAWGLPGVFVQGSISRNHKCGTLRGLHFQAAPRPESKLVRCIRGAAYDVLVDLRRDSPTFRRWFGAELSESNRRAVFVPAGFAHGFQTLADHTDLLYQMTESYVAELAGGVRWDDPAFGITWPLPVSVISGRDRGFPGFT